MIHTCRCGGNVKPNGFIGHPTSIQARLFRCDRCGKNYSQKTRKPIKLINKEAK